VYFALAASIASGKALTGALYMTFFGFGNRPFLFGIAYLIDFLQTIQQAQSASHCTLLLAHHGYFIAGSWIKPGYTLS
jgi:sulfite exporter TauE/SafE